MSGAEQALEPGIKQAIATLRAYMEHGHGMHGDAKRAAAELFDHIDWLEKGLAEWRDLWKVAARQNGASQASLRIAIGHLHAMLAPGRNANESFAADAAARDWLESIGSEPT